MATSQVQGKAPFDTKLLSFDAVQEALLSRHGEELHYIHSHGPRRSLFQRVFQFIFGEDFYALVTGSLIQLGQIVFFLLGNPLYAFVDPLGFLYGLAAYTLLFSGLTAFASTAYVVKALHIDRLFLDPLRNNYGGGLSLVNCALPEIFGLSIGTNPKARQMAEQRSREIIQRGVAALTKEPARHCHLDSHGRGVHPLHAEGMPKQEENAIQRLGSSRLAVFDLDIARMLLVFSALVYERKSEKVAQAARAPPQETSLLLVESERTIYETVLRFNGIRYVTVSDFVTETGPFVGAFYPDIAAGTHKGMVKPWICLVFKFLEWQTDATLAHVDSSDNFFPGSAAHRGFYEKLFPATGSDAPSQPHRSIYDAVKAIASDLYAKTGEKSHLWITGHSLGAGLASLYFTYQLLHRTRAKNEPIHFRLRDGYCFGAPSVGDAHFVSGFESLYNEKGNTCTLFRVRNSADIVAVVPPGLANDRDNRLALNPAGLLDYGQIGIEIQLLPYLRAPYMRVIPTSVPSGTQVTVIQDESPYENPKAVVSSSKTGGFNPIALFDMLATIVAPYLANHGPTQYYESLFKMSDPAILGEATNDKNHFVSLPREDVYTRNRVKGLLP